MGGVSEEVKTVELILDPPLRHVIARNRMLIAGVIEVAQGSKEGSLLSLELLEVHLLQGLLVEASLGLLLGGGVVAPPLAHRSRTRGGARLDFLGVVGDEVIEVVAPISTSARPIASTV